MAKLYEITESLRLLETMLENAESEDDRQAAIDTIESVEFDLEQKVDNIVKLIRNKESDKKALEEEKKRFDERAKRIGKDVDSLKDYLYNQLKKIDKPKYETTLFTISVAKNPAKLVIDNEDLVPADYVVAKFETDKTKLKEAMKDEKVQEELSKLGIRLEQGESIRIR